MYQSECAPKKLRGLIVGLYQLAITVGALLSAVVLNATQSRLDHSAWRIPIAIQFVWAAILSGGMICLPESPRYLLLKGREDEARVSLGRLLTRPSDSPDVERQRLEIVAALEAEQKLGSSTYADCFRNTDNRNGFRTWTGILLQAWQQLTGINFIFYYGTTFFMQAGIGNAFLIQIIADIVNTVMTIVGVQLIDRVGRRRLLLIGAVGMCIAEFIIAIVGVTAGQINPVTQAVNKPAQKVLIAFVCIYIAFFAISWGPVVWVITGEIFPLAIRAKGMSLSVASNWLWNFGIGYATPYLVNASTTGINAVKAANLGVKVFFIWGGTCVGCFIFTYFFVPETKGLSLEQIDLLYRESSIVGSDKYRREMLEKGETFLTNLEHEKEAHINEEKTDSV
jgi:sugar porter (SP) family MFS transporter